MAKDHPVFQRSAGRSTDSPTDQVPAMAGPQTLGGREKPSNTNPCCGVNPENSPSPGRIPAPNRRVIQCPPAPQQSNIHRVSLGFKEQARGF
jgi:hypothetical protein